ncbi:hypothetical protein [Streptomyces sp. NPDC048188]
MTPPDAHEAGAVHERDEDEAVQQKDEAGAVHERDEDEAGKAP